MARRMTPFVGYYFFALAIVWLAVSLAAGRMDFMFVVFLVLGWLLRYRSGAARPVAVALGAAFGLLVLLHVGVLIAWGKPTRIEIAGWTMTSESALVPTLLLGAVAIACLLIPSAVLARDAPGPPSTSGPTQSL